jgi:ubiquinone/menaquinone biosynthesis C-methylase UbiE
MAAKTGVPTYDRLLRASHRAFAAEHRRSIAGLPLSASNRVLDMACGDGFFGRFLAQRLDSRGLLIECDLRPEYLSRAQDRLTRSAGTTSPPETRFVLGNAYRLPFDNAFFDIVWCAQSFISLDHPILALHELRRVTAPNGHVAILESDEFHHLLLPWPLSLESALWRALQKANLLRYGDPSKTAVGRKIPAMFSEARLKLVATRTCCGNRTAPFDTKLRRFLKRHFDALSERVCSHLRRSERKQFEEFTDPEHRASIWLRANAELTCLSTVYLGQPM